MPGLCITAPSRGCGRGNMLATVCGAEEGEHGSAAGSRSPDSPDPIGSGGPETGNDRSSRSPQSTGAAGSGTTFIGAASSDFQSRGGRSSAPETKRRSGVVVENQRSLPGRKLTGSILESSSKLMQHPGLAEVRGSGKSEDFRCAFRGSRLHATSLLGTPCLIPTAGFLV